MMWSHYHYVQGSSRLRGGCRSAETSPSGRTSTAGTTARLRWAPSSARCELRGLVGQFGIALPGDGPDCTAQRRDRPVLEGSRSPGDDNGYVPPNRTIDGPTDADDRRRAGGGRHRVHVRQRRHARACGCPTATRASTTTCGRRCSTSSRCEARRTATRSAAGSVRPDALVRARASRGRARPADLRAATTVRTALTDYSRLDPVPVGPDRARHERRSHAGRDRRAGAAARPVRRRLLHDRVLRHGAAPRPPDPRRGAGLVRRRRRPTCFRCPRRDEAERIVARVRWPRHRARSRRGRRWPTTRRRGRHNSRPICCGSTPTMPMAAAVKAGALRLIAQTVHIGQRSLVVHHAGPRARGTRSASTGSASTTCALGGYWKRRPRCTCTRSRCSSNRPAPTSSSVCSGGSATSGTEASLRIRRGVAVPGNERQRSRHHPRPRSAHVGGAVCGRGHRRAMPRQPADLTVTGDRTMLASLLRGLRPAPPRRVLPHLTPRALTLVARADPSSAGVGEAYLTGRVGAHLDDVQRARELERPAVVRSGQTGGPHARPTTGPLAPSSIRAARTGRRQRSDAR